MAKVKNGKREPKGPIFPVGSECLVKRPNLYAGCVGVVEKMSDGFHILKIPLKDPTIYTTHCHIEASGEELEYNL